METFSPDVIFLTILLTTIASIAYFIVISYMITRMDKRHFVRKVIVQKDIVQKEKIRNKTAGDNANQKKHLTSMILSIAFVVSIAKIIVGLFLLVCGVLMLVLPGQSIITILIGLSLIPFPGKNKIEQYLISRKSVRSSLNWIRLKAKKEPFIFD
ncbi:MAG: hypothetical protein ACJAXJ_001954 [Colwellia sp.]|jgi:hypothetical protein